MFVGGAAGNLYGATRATQDVDILVRRTPENLDRVGAALRELNARLRVEGFTDEEAKALPQVWDGITLGRTGILTLQTDAGQLDVLPDIPDADGRRLTYDDLLPSAESLPLRPGFAALVASPAAIIASKEWAGRPKDHEALPELRALAARRQPPASQH